MNQPSWLPIKLAIEENLIDFPLFSQSELDYSKSRIEHLSNISIPKTLHLKASRLSDGHYVLYKTLVSQAETEPILNAIWDGLSTLDKQNGNFSIPLLPPLPRSKEITPSGESLPQLTAQQKLIFDYLNSHPQQVISRDEIAQTIWGKLWQEKYSDWAIDRSISQLKKRLLTTKYLILTLRGRGYKLSL